MIWEIRPVRLEDWGSFLDCWTKFKAGPDAKQVDGSDDTVRSLFEMSLVHPGVKILVLLSDSVVRGFALLTESHATRVNQATGAVETIMHGFVRGIHIQQGVPLRHSLAMETHICAWGRSRNHPFLTGYCSEEYFERAKNPYIRMGWTKSHIVVVKQL